MRAGMTEDERSTYTLPCKPFENEWHIERCSYDVAMDLILYYHYMHRRCPCSRAYVLINSAGGIDGVVTYGVPPSPTLLRGVCGDDEAQNVYELNRLWVRDTVPRNGESYLIAHTIRDLDKEIVVSFSDTSVGHVGYVYQACNFLYCGQSARFRDVRVKGHEGQHHATYAYGLSNAQVIEKFGADNVYFVDRPRKHRYVYFNASGSRKDYLRSRLRYKIQPYPKGDARRHDISESYGY